MFPVRATTCPELLLLVSGPRPAGEDAEEKDSDTLLQVCRKCQVLLELSLHTLLHFSRRGETPCGGQPLCGRQARLSAGCLPDFPPGVLDIVW